MSKLKVITVVGTRPEIIRLSKVFEKLDLYFDHVSIHTGQNYDYELNKIFYDDLKIRKPNYFLNSAKQSLPVAQIISNIISGTDKIIQRENPDAFLILGDTNSCLSALSAKKRKVPIFHMEAGNRCFDLRVPEEVNRKLVDHLSDINLPYSKIAREYLLNEGIDSDRIICTGSPIHEVLSFHKQNINKSKIKEKLKLAKNDFFLLSFHREENIENEKNFNNICNFVDYLDSKFKKKIIISTHPRTKKKLLQRKIKFSKNVSTLKPLGYFDYINLQINAYLVISDSGTINEEASILNFAAINLRESHERPEAMEETSVLLSGLDINSLRQSVNLALSQKNNINFKLCSVKDYVSENVSDKIIRILQSYTHYINRKYLQK